MLCMRPSPPPFLFCILFTFQFVWVHIPPPTPSQSFIENLPDLISCERFLTLINLVVNYMYMLKSLPYVDVTLCDHSAPPLSSELHCMWTSRTPLVIRCCECVNPLSLSYVNVCVSYVTIFVVVFTVTTRPRKQINLVCISTKRCSLI